MCATFLAWYKACQVQGLDRNMLPFRAFWQLYCAWYGMIGCAVMASVGGYAVRTSKVSRSIKLDN